MIHGKTVPHHFCHGLTLPIRSPSRAGTAAVRGECRASGSRPWAATWPVIEWLPRRARSPRLRATAPPWRRPVAACPAGGPTCSPRLCPGLLVSLSLSPARTWACWARCAAAAVRAMRRRGCTCPPSAHAAPRCARGHRSPPCSPPARPQAPPAIDRHIKPHHAVSRHVGMHIVPYHTMSMPMPMYAMCWVHHVISYHVPGPCVPARERASSRVPRP